MAKRKEVRTKKNSPGALFIPAGFLLGFGIGFAVNNVPAGMFIGLGAGFLAWVIYEIFSKK
ncbi:MAG: hypothetical protein PHH54_01990 [Candidatus Nanoarchaeia archaeon]|nr:hypothetical protein [Candidatus Nanoarchaeia archaeon]MDD5740733.1 hypothetical protein [Candidatus Nanoarchaeia archaeon]